MTFLAVFGHENIIENQTLDFTSLTPVQGYFEAYKWEESVKTYHISVRTFKIALSFFCIRS